MLHLMVPPLAFAVMLALARGIMAFAGRIAAVGREGNGKKKHYACGEDLEFAPVKPDYTRFFAVAFAYSVIHVSVLTIAVIAPGRGALIAAAYLGVVFLAILALITELKLVAR